MDTYAFLADPRALPLAERRATAARLHNEQAVWLPRVRQLADGPAPDEQFPAFLLATPPFADLARRLGNTTRRCQLPTEVADELDWFVLAFTDYLRTCDGEDSFAPVAPQRC